MLSSNSHTPCTNPPLPPPPLRAGIERHCFKSLRRHHTGSSSRWVRLSAWRWRERPCTNHTPRGPRSCPPSRPAPPHAWLRRVPAPALWGCGGARTGRERGSRCRTAESISLGARSVCSPLHLRSALLVVPARTRTHRLGWCACARSWSTLLLHVPFASAAHASSCSLHSPCLLPHAASMRNSSLSARLATRATPSHALCCLTHDFECTHSSLHALPPPPACSNYQQQAPCVRLFLSTWVRPALRSATPAGSCTAW